MAQSKNFVKISCEQHLNRVFDRHGWTTITSCAAVKSTPLSSDRNILAEIETTAGPKTITESRELEKEWFFHIRPPLEN